MCIETGQIFNSIKEAEEYFHTSQDCIGKVCRGEVKTAYGKHFKFL